MISFLIEVANKMYIILLYYRSFQNSAVTQHLHNFFSRKQRL